jgi:bifunctional DNA-binding transcriptional regulator/antitoxin component of YhaV-PrlF toxin-antitoxin module
MGVTAIVESDGRIVVDAVVTREVGLLRGDKVLLKQVDDQIVVSRERDLQGVFERWKGFRQVGAGKSLAEILKEERDLRGDDDLG